MSIKRMYRQITLMSNMLMKAENYEETIQKLRLMLDDVGHVLWVKCQIGWCCPNDDMISAIVNNMMDNNLPLVSIGCGRGLIELLVHLKLKKLGIDGKGWIYASDPHLYDISINAAIFYPHVDWKYALEAVYEANLTLGDQYMLLISWPSLGEKWETNALKAARATHVGYVVESLGGMTGDDELNNLLCRGHEQDTPYETVCTVNIPTSPEVSDFFTICRKKGHLSDVLTNV